MDWNEVHCLVTGGAGFIGSHLVDELVRRRAVVRVMDDLSRGKTENIGHCLNRVDLVRGDLKDIPMALKSVSGMDFCFHLAAVVGGVGFMKTHPARMCENILIDHNVLEACRQSDVKRILYVSSACVYPISLQTDASCPPLKEEDALSHGADPDGYYGWAKLMGEIQCRAYHEEYGMRIGVVRPFNPYGPRESFNPEDSHVIPALIRKALCKEDPFVVWGSGKQERSFTYISDLVEGIILAIEKVNSADPMNLGSDRAVSTKKLAETVLKLSGYNVPIIYDKSKPEGVKSRKADVSRAIRVLGWKQKTSLKAGLTRTIDWYLKHKAV